MEKGTNLERRLKIDERIDQLLEWNKEYPMLRLDKTFQLYDYSLFLPDEDRERYDAIERIIERFEKLKSVYNYVRQRYILGKLTQEQIDRCKEGNVRGVFGYPESTEKIAQNFGFNIEELDGILSRYGTIEDYLLQENLGNHYSGSILFEVNLNRDAGIEKLLHDGMGLNRLIYNRDIILDQLNEIKLPKNQKRAIMEYYGISSEKTKNIGDIAGEIGVSSSAVSNYIIKALETLKKHEKNMDITFIPSFDEIGLEDRIRIIEALGNYAFRQPNAYDVNNLNELVAICKAIEKYGTTSISDDERETIDIKEQIENLQAQIEVGKISVEKLGLSTRERNSLLRAGIYTVQEIIDYDEEHHGRGLEKLHNLGSLGANNIRERIAEYRQIIEAKKLLEEDEQKILQEDNGSLPREIILETSVIELELPIRIKNGLIRSGINNLRDLLGRNRKELLKIRKLGRGSVDELILKLSEYGIGFNQEGKLEDLLHGVETIDSNGQQTEQLEQQNGDGIIIDSSTSQEGTIRAQNTKTPSELTMLREKRDKLLVKQEEIQGKVRAAKELVVSYEGLNKSMGEKAVDSIEE